MPRLSAPDVYSLGRVLLRNFGGALLALVITTSNAAGDPASGQFSGTRLKLDISGAYGFWAKGGTSGNDPVIRVAVSNSKINSPYMDGWYDRQNAISELIVDDEHKVAYFDFDADGKYRGLSFYFGSGDGCGYCYDSAVRSTVRVDAGRLKGKIAHKARDGAHAFDVDFDVAVPGKVWGNALPKDGGDPWRAYLAYHKALEAQDAKALAATMDARGKALLVQQQKDGNLKQDLEFRWSEMHFRMKRLSIVGGYVRDDVAVVLFDGGNPTIERVHGEARIRREGGVWLFEDELVQIGAR